MKSPLLSGIIAPILAYALAVLAFVVAYFHPTDYQPPSAEYVIVPGLMMAYHPVVSGVTLLLCYGLVRLTLAHVFDVRSRVEDPR